VQGGKQRFYSCSAQLYAHKPIIFSSWLVAHIIVHYINTRKKVLFFQCGNGSLSGLKTLTWKSRRCCLFQCGIEIFWNNFLNNIKLYYLQQKILQWTFAGNAWSNVHYSAIEMKQSRNFLIRWLVGMEFVYRMAAMRSWKCKKAHWICEQ
jgi:hypothetical protein